MVGDDNAFLQLGRNRRLRLHDDGTKAALGYADDVDANCYHFNALQQFLTPLPVRYCDSGLRKI